MFLLFQILMNAQTNPLTHATQMQTVQTPTVHTNVDAIRALLEMATLVQVLCRVVFFGKATKVCTIQGQGQEMGIHAQVLFSSCINTNSRINSLYRVNILQILTNALGDPTHVIKMQPVPILMVHSNANVKLVLQGMGVHAQVCIQRF